ncbi:hypothetical protein OH76DRAFT_1490373 [Lentinus brumalis]|uniref:Integrase core domain-containing protein n=1 Tax=Lentinus brumalis TaxID=2498619 RepID=A0A371CJ83_9APHY|nr:hypothetical protein OH76DRAFT_1490373 [Polyporus brumalis]
MSNNPSGHNQWGVKSYPPDEELYEAFLQFAKEKNGAGLNEEEQLARLKTMGLNIKRGALYKLRKRLNVPSVRKATKTADKLVLEQAVIDIKSDDVLGRWGIGQVRQRLANANHFISRNALREILLNQFGPEFNRRQPGFKQPDIARRPLSCLGPWHQLHVDGHEKLSKQALRIGDDVTLPIYTMKDQFSSLSMILITAPNIRLAESCAHIYLDFVEEHQCVPITLVSDHGSEIGIMAQFQKILRADAAPEFDEEEWPATLAVRSVHNTPAESFWLWLRLGEGHNIRDVILEGAARVFNSADMLHVHVFNWLWPPLLQARLDEFQAYWNNHLIRTQREKLNTSGTSPLHAFSAPESVRSTACNCAIKVNMNLVNELRAQIGGAEGRRAAFEFVSPEFKAMADDVYGNLGYPSITLETAWDVFIAVVGGLRGVPLHQ